MISIQTRTHIGADGALSVHIPTELRETDVEVTLMVQPVHNHDAASGDKPDGQDSGYPPGFFEETYGSFRDEPLERLPQGESEQREPIL